MPDAKRVRSCIVSMDEISPSPIFFEPGPRVHVDLECFRFLKQRSVRVGKEPSLIVPGHLLQLFSEVQDLPLPALHFAAGIEVENLHAKEADEGVGRGPGGPPHNTSAPDS